MLVEAIYEDGKILFPQKLNFAHNRFGIKVDVPEEEILKSADSVGNPSPMESKIADIRGSLSVEMAVINFPGKTETLPTEYLEFVKLRESVLGKDYVYVQEKTDRELMQEHWIEKYA